MKRPAKPSSIGDAHTSSTKPSPLPKRLKTVQHRRSSFTIELLPAQKDLPCSRFAPTTAPAPARRHPLGDGHIKRRTRRASFEVQDDAKAPEECTKERSDALGGDRHDFQALSCGHTPEPVGDIHLEQLKSTKAHNGSPIDQKTEESHGQTSASSFQRGGLQMAKGKHKESEKTGTPNVGLDVTSELFTSLRKLCKDRVPYDDTSFAPVVHEERAPSSGSDECGHHGVRREPDMKSDTKRPRIRPLERERDERNLENLERAKRLRVAFGQRMQHPRCASQISEDKDSVSGTDAVKVPRAPIWDGISTSPGKNATRTASDSTEVAESLDRDEGVENDGGAEGPTGVTSELYKTLRRLCSRSHVSSSKPLSECSGSEELSRESRHSGEGKPRGKAKASELSTQAQTAIPISLSWNPSIISLKESPFRDTENSSTDKNPSTTFSGRKGGLDREQEIEAQKKHLSTLSIDTARTPSDFKRLLLTDTNNSELWIRYIALMLELHSITEARLLFDKALDRIGFDEQGEKLKVWKARLNMEARFGSPLTLRNAIRDAQAMSDQRAVLMHAVHVYKRKNLDVEAQEMLSLLVKKHPSDIRVWLFALNHQSRSDTRDIMERAKNKLNNSDWVRLVQACGIWESKHGNEERARTILEGLVAEFPKRTDLWTVYVDVEMRLNCLDRARAIMERAIAVDPGKHAVKKLFKKYLDIEKAHGTDETVETVKAMAMEYVSRLMATE